MGTSVLITENWHKTTARIEKDRERYLDLATRIEAVERARNRITHGLWVWNLAVWFAIHTIFHAVRPVRAFGLGFDAPVLSSADPWALALSAVAVVAIFRFKVGMIQTLAAGSAAGIALYLGGVAA